MIRNKKTFFKTEYKIITVSVLFGILFGISDALIDYLFFFEGTFWEILITEITIHELYARLIVLVFFLLFGLIFLNVIKKRKLIENNLRKSEERFKTLFDGVPVGLYRTTPNGEIVDANNAMVEILCYPDRESLLNVNAADLYVNPVERERILIKENETGILHDVEVQLKKYDGTHIWIQYSSNAIKDKNNKVRFYEGSLRDITEHKKAESQRKAALKALYESEEKFKAINLSAADAIMMIDNEGKITDWNEAASKMFGFTDNEVIGKDLHSILVPEKYMEAINKAFPKFQKTGSGSMIGKTAELSALRKGGTEFAIELSLSALNIKNKWHAVGIVRDMTERKRTEKINSVISQISEATIITKDLDELLRVIHKLLGQIIDATNFYIALYNENSGKYSFPYFVDEHNDVEDIEPNKLPKSLTDYVRRTGKPLLADEKINMQLIKEGEVEMVGEPTSIWLGVPLKSTRGIIGVVVVQSYSDGFLYTKKDLELLTLVSGNIALAIERKNAEEQIKKSRVQLQNLSQKLQKVREDEKESIAYGIYEDYSQVLAVLIMDISWLQKTVPQEDTQLIEKLNSMKSLADKGIKDLLRVKEELRSSQLDFIGLDAAIQWYLEELQKRSGVKFKLKYKIADIELSKNFLVMLYRVFEELLKNVEQHSDAKNVSVYVGIKDSLIEMQVNDDGIGIGVDKIDDSKSIGFIDIKERIRPYNGEVIFEGDQNKGTTVKVRIPLDRITDDSDKLNLFDDM